MLRVVKNTCLTSVPNFGTTLDMPNNFGSNDVDEFRDEDQGAANYCCGACGCFHNDYDGCDPLEVYVHAYEPGEAIVMAELESFDFVKVLASLRRRGLSVEGVDGGGWSVCRTVAA